jgi:hypothetical protein
VGQQPVEERLHHAAECGLRARCCAKGIQFGAAEGESVRCSWRSSPGAVSV